MKKMRKMKNILLTISLALTFSISHAQKATASPDPAKPLVTVEASCGQCQFHMEGKGCDLAVRIDGKAYYVDGTSIDEHGNAHAKDGFCEAVREAEVQGEVVDNRFRVSYFKLLPEKK